MLLHGIFERQMRILITGGMGFLGGRIGQYLMSSGNEILIGTRSNCSILPESMSRAKVYKIEWLNKSSLEKACRGVDVIVHAAGMNVSECFSDPTEALRVNGLATANLLYSGISSGVKKFLYISTGHIYSNPLQGNVNEGCVPENLHPYASSHYAGEQVIRFANQRDLINGVVIRLSNGYGKPMYKGANCWMLLVNDLCRQAVEKGEMSLNSSGSQLRDFIPMTSVCKIIHELIIKPQSYDVYNVGSGHAMSVWEMANLVKQCCERILGRETPLYRSGLTQKDVQFQYNVQRLSESMIQYEIDHNQEIEDLVHYCVKHFS
jgi:UDP-glucose 4-epimerase